MEGENIVTAEAIIDNGRFGKRRVRFETGQLAKQAAGSALAYLDEETVVLSATCVGKQPKDQFDFFPLTVDVEERQYAAGRIPGSFFRREGRPGTDAILAARLIDRPLRPGFVKGLRNEVQVVETVLAIHPDYAYDVLAINAASMSTQIAGLPFTGPIGGTRLALIDGQWVAFPRWSEMERSVFNMVVAGRIVQKEDGTDDVAIMMVEAGGGDNEWELIQQGATKPTEEVVADGLEAAKPFIRALCEAQIQVAQKAAKETTEFPLFFDYTDEEFAAVQNAVAGKLEAALRTEGRQKRDEAVEAVREAMLEELAEQFPESEKALKAAFRSIEKETIRQRTLREGIRLDGRKPTEIRSLLCEVEVLPRVHGSALFQRGETQILGVTTLAMLRMEQQVDNLSPQMSKRYMHQYNFPPFSTGEVGRVGSPKRREIGHGDLAERALRPVIPSREDFPYAIRQVSEALGSNGSTSMGSVCASTMSLLQAGVPLRAPVAGIAMGLMTGEVDGQSRSVTLTDILGAEDGFGDMDFKVAGTADFITALQLDTKLDGIDSQVLRAALAQAREARLHILNYMTQAISEPDEISAYAPRISTVQIPVDKIGEVIGPKGKMINQIQEDTGADITIEDDGTVYVAATSGSSAEAARTMINQIANPQLPEIGERFVGTVVKTTSFGAFVSLLPGRDGLLHISQVRRLIGGRRVESVEDVLHVGQQVEVEIAEIDDRGKLSLHAVVDEATEAAVLQSEQEARERRSRGHRSRGDFRSWNEDGEPRHYRSSGQNGERIERIEHAPNRSLHESDSSERGVERRRTRFRRRRNDGDAPAAGFSGEPSTAAASLLTDGE